MSATRNIGRLMGLVQADTAEGEFTPRQQLRTAISAAAAARAELEMIEAASSWNGEAGLAVTAAEAAVETAKAALEESKRGTAQAFIQRALGTPEGFGVTIQQARLDLQVSQDELEAAKTAQDTLRSMIPDAASKVQNCEYKVDQAVKAVIAAEVLPHTQRIWEEHARITRTAQELEGVVDWLHRRSKAIGSSHLPIPAVNAYDGAQVWREAEKALHTDPDASLPHIPGTMGTPQKR